MTRIFICDTMFLSGEQMSLAHEQRPETSCTMLFAS
nr:MAG TPA_asm: hypothetical protein [Caudoviricetes sp.]